MTVISMCIQDVFQCGSDVALHVSEIGESEALFLKSPDWAGFLPLVDAVALFRDEFERRYVWSSRGWTRSSEREGLGY